MGRQRHEAEKRAWGMTDEGFPNTPTQLSNVRLARIAHGGAQGCAFCFPHGSETRNSRWRKHRRSWKYHRQTRYRPTPAA